MIVHSASLSLPAGLGDDQAGSFASALGDDGLDPAPLAGSAIRAGRDHRNAWTLQWLFEDPPDPDRLASRLQRLNEHLAIGAPAIDADLLTLDTVETEGWLQKSYHAHPPFSVGGFYLYGSHVETPSPPPGEQMLQMDAATAFGSGEHGTTAGCLKILRRLADDGFRPSRVLDLGTGSGILAIAAWMLWRVPVLATDIDAEAILVTARHAAANNLPEGAIQGHVADGFDAIVRSGAPYDLVIANILAPPLRAMAADIVAATTAGGRILLSGMLAEQTDSVVPLYEDKGCRMTARLLEGDWASVLLDRDV